MNRVARFHSIQFTIEEKIHTGIETNRTRVATSPSSSWFLNDGVELNKTRQDKTPQDKTGWFKRNTPSFTSSLHRIVLWEEQKSIAEGLVWDDYPQCRQSQSHSSLNLCVCVACPRLGIGIWRWFDACFGIYRLAGLQVGPLIFADCLHVCMYDIVNCRNGLLYMHTYTRDEAMGIKGNRERSCFSCLLQIRAFKNNWIETLRRFEDGLVSMID